MTDVMRKMLDELMGTQRDGQQDGHTVKFYDLEVCKSYLLGLCPYDLFHNTGSFKSSKKLDLGVCNKVHDPALKADYEAAAKSKTYDYEYEQLEKIRQFVGDCDRKVNVNKRRLEETQDSESLGPEALAVHELNEQIGIKLAEAEELGNKGDVEESMAMLAKVEELKADKRKAEDIYRNTVPATTNQQQKLRVCEICAAFLSLYDNDRRLADHFGGRLHMGFIQVRTRLEELEEIVKNKRKAQSTRDDKSHSDEVDSYKDRSYRDRDHRDRRDRDRERESTRHRDRDRYREKDRERDRNRERKRRSRSRSRDRERRRHRSRSSERRKSRDHSRDRKRERSRHSRDRDSEKTSERKENSETFNRIESVEDGEVVDQKEKDIESEKKVVAEEEEKTVENNQPSGEDNNEQTEGQE